jgi:hypothetical protein
VRFEEFPQQTIFFQRNERVLFLRECDRYIFITVCEGAMARRAEAILAPGVPGMVEKRIARATRIVARREQTNIKQTTLRQSI